MPEGREDECVGAAGGETGMLGVEIEIAGATWGRRSRGDERESTGPRVDDGVVLMGS